MMNKVSTSSLRTKELTLKYGARTIIEGLTLSFAKPEVVSIIGPNGSGKSTLLKSLCDLLQPQGGVVYLNNKALRELSATEIAKQVAVMAQTAQAPHGVTVEELVAYGRMPYRKFLDGLSSEDRMAVEEAIAFTELGRLRKRLVHTLSGGERQRAWLALALAQKPQILLLDEPTTYLDVHHQLELMELVQRLHREKQMMIIMVLHDLNHAARYSQRLIALKNGVIMADGPTEEVFVTEIIQELYDVRAVVMKVEANGVAYPVCFPYTTEHDA